MKILTGVVIRLGDADKTENELLKVLGTILSNKKSVNDKIEIMKEYDLPLTQTVERKVGNMYSLADIIAEEAAEEAKEKREEETMLWAIENIMESFGVTIEKAMDALKIPQEKRSIYVGRVQNGWSTASQMTCIGKNLFRNQERGAGKFHTNTPLYLEAAFA